MMPVSSRSNSPLLSLEPSLGILERLKHSIVRIWDAIIGGFKAIGFHIRSWVWAGIKTIWQDEIEEENRPLHDLKRQLAEQTEKFDEEKRTWEIDKSLLERRIQDLIRKRAAIKTEMDQLEKRVEQKCEEIPLARFDHEVDDQAWKELIRDLQSDGQDRPALLEALTELANDHLVPPQVDLKVGDFELLHETYFAQLEEYGTTVLRQCCSLGGTKDLLFAEVAKCIKNVKEVGTNTMKCVKAQEPLKLSLVTLKVDTLAELFDIYFSQLEECEKKIHQVRQLCSLGGQKDMFFATVAKCINTLKEVGADILKCVKAQELSK